MKQTILKLVLGMAFFFLCLAGKQEEVKADIIYWPEDGFEKENKDTCVEVRDCYEVSAEAVDVYETPDSTVSYDKIKKGETHLVYWLHEDDNDNLWGCIGGRFWVPMDGMAKIYDHDDFVAEHCKNVGNYDHELDKYEIKLPLDLYEYPGSESVIYTAMKDWGDWTGGADWLVPELIYASDDGEVWGYIDTYNWGYVKGWYRISDFPQNAIRDYDNSGSIDLADAQTVLKASLKIVDKVKYTVDDVDYGYSLSDAQLVLKAALKITYELPILSLPIKEDDVVTGDADVPFRIPVEAAGVDCVELYKEVLAMYPCYKGDYIALSNYIPHLYNGEKKKLEDYIAEVKGMNVIWADSDVELVQNGYGTTGEYSHIRYLNGTLYSIYDVTVWDNGTMRICGSLEAGYGIGQSYETCYEKQDGKWVLVSHERIGIQ